MAIKRQYDPAFSKTVKAGKRTYYMDVIPSKSGKDFLVTITECKRTEEGVMRHRLFLFKEDFGKFIDALDETIDFVEAKLKNV